MATTYGWQSKRYTFGAARDAVGAEDVAATVQAGIPSRLTVAASYYAGIGDTVRLVARLGGQRTGIGTVSAAANGALTFSTAPTPALTYGQIVLIGGSAYPIVSGSGTNYVSSRQVAAASTTSWSVVTELELLKHTGTGVPATDEPALTRLDEEIDLLQVASDLIPGYEADWYISFRVEITSDYLDPTPESVDWPFVRNEAVELYLYRNIITQQVEVRSDPVSDTELVASWRSPAQGDRKYLPLQGVQALFFFKDSNPPLRAATVLSDTKGRVATSLPPATYNVRFMGSGINEEYFLVDDRALTVGTGSNLTPWRNASTPKVAQSAEFNCIKSQFGTLYWPGYVVAEDFTPERAPFRDESAETNAYGDNYAIQLFGRVFAGKSYVDYIGVAIDPPPE